MRIALKAWYFLSRVDLQRIRDHFPDNVREMSDPLLLVFEENRKVCITSFGTIVFWPFDLEFARKIVAQMKPLIADPTLVEEVEDRLIVYSDKGTAKVLFNEIWLDKEPTDGQVRIISHLFAQSVALDFREIEVDQALVRFEQYLSDLRKRGRIAITTRKINKSIGFAMGVRYAVLNSLALFDKPDVTWESEELEGLYTNLYQFFELDHRQRTLGRKVDFLYENSSLLSEFINTRKGLWLEWTIVLLIAVEIVLFLFTDFF